MPILSNLIVRIGATTDDFDKKVGNSLNKIKRLGSEVSAAGQAIAIGFSVPMIAAGGFALKAAADMEKLSMSLGVVSGGSAQAAAEMDKLKTLAKLPGLGLAEAVQGSVRLQMLGTSADKARLVMAELGNALAIAGGGKADFAEVVRQLSQLQATGKVTKENLDPIVERIPQIAKLMLDTFGPQSVSDPAKFFEKAGIDSAQFIDIITQKLSQGARAGNTFQNSMDNMSDAASNAAAEFGKTLLPIAQRVLDEFLTPGIEKAKQWSIAFAALPTQTQNWALQLSAVVVAAPMVVVALGTIVEKGALLWAVAAKLGGPLKAMAALFSGIGLWATAGGLGVAAFLKILIDHGAKPIDTTAEAIKNLNKNFDGQIISSGQAGDSIMGYMKLLGPTTEATKKATKAAEDNVKSIKVKSVADLIYVESLERVKLAVGKVKDVMYEWSIAGTILGKQLETVRDPMPEMILATEMYRKELQLLVDVTKNVQAIQKPFEFPELPKAQQPFPNLPGNKNISMKVMLGGMDRQFAATFKESSKIAKESMHQVSLVINDLAKGITDVIFKGGKIGDMFKNVAMQAAQSITRILIEGALTRLAAKLIGVGGLMAGIFGGAGAGAATAAATATATAAATAAAASGTGAAVGGIASGAGAAAGGAASASSGIGSVVAAANPIVAMVTAVSSVVSAISAVVANFQFAAMNKSLDIIVKHTLQAANDLANLRADEWLREGHLMAKLDDMWRTNLGIFDLLGKGGIAGTTGGGGGNTFNITVTGGDTRAVMESLTRMLKLHGAIPANA